jgi:hypothetical protein
MLARFALRAVQKSDPKDPEYPTSLPLALLTICHIPLADCATFPGVTTLVCICNFPAESTPVHESVTTLIVLPVTSEVTGRCAAQAAAPADTASA